MVYRKNKTYCWRFPRNSWNVYSYLSLIELRYRLVDTETGKGVKNKTINNKVIKHEDAKCNPFLQESGCGRRKNEVRSQIEVSALNFLHYFVAVGNLVGW